MPHSPALVLVMVGTDYHPFTRMIEWTDRWVAAQPAGSVECLVQYGTTSPPVHATGQDYLPREELDALLGRAEVVLCHGGPSTIVETRRRGLMPIVLPRSGTLGEHVDDHQRRFAAAMAGRGLIRLVDDEAALHAALDSAVRSPLRIGADDTSPDPSVAALRLGRLVDGLVSRQRRRGSTPAA